MLNVIAEAKEVEKAEVDEVAEKQKTDVGLMVSYGHDEAAKLESWTVEDAMLLLLLMLLRLWSWNLK